MTLFNLFYFLGVILFYILTAAIAGLIPALVIYRLYYYRMKKYQEATGLNPYRIPCSLRKLIFLAKKWGLKDDAKRRQITQDASVQEKLELSKLIMGKDELIYRWLSRFTENTLSPEAKAYECMMRSVEEMNLIVRDSSPSNDPELRGQNYSIITDDAIVKRKPIIGNRVRVIKLNSCISLPFFILAFIGYFILFGKLWSILAPNDPNDIGVVAINCLSGAATVFTWAIFVSIAKMIRIPGIEIRVR